MRTARREEGDLTCGNCIEKFIESIEHDATAQWRSRPAMLNAKAFEKLCSRQDGL